MFLQMGIQSADSCETCITIFAFEGFCIAMNTATVSRDFTPSKSDQSSIYFGKTQGQGSTPHLTQAKKNDHYPGTKFFFANWAGEYLFWFVISWNERVIQASILLQYHQRVWISIYHVFEIQTRFLWWVFIWFCIRLIIEKSSVDILHMNFFHISRLKINTLEI